MKQNQKRRQLLWLLRILCTLCVIGTVVFIFQNSLEVAQESGSKSEQVQQIVNAVAATVGAGPFSVLAIRKMAHFSEFAMLGFWMMLCVRLYWKRYLKLLSWPLFAGLLTAVLDETIQRYVPGRASSTVDVLIDFAGNVSGLLAALLLIWVITGIAKWNTNRKNKGGKHIGNGC